MPWMLDFMILSHRFLNNIEKNWEKKLTKQGEYRGQKVVDAPPYSLKTTASQIRKVPLTQSFWCQQAPAANALAVTAITAVLCYHKITWGREKRKQTKGEQRKLEDFSHSLWALGVPFPTLWATDRELLLELSLCIQCLLLYLGWLEFIPCKSYHQFKFCLLQPAC